MVLDCLVMVSRGWLVRKFLPRNLDLRYWKPDLKDQLTYAANTSRVVLLCPMYTIGCLCAGQFSLAVMCPSRLFILLSLWWTT
ncbi:hypothetical protein BDV32DRAFT_33400 [Aspergillus pseudonomiae]|uniref:Uncharacterized protein n=1 Tax=Aspergillus pseudonomiae TaxID=1506151 RepID=A0A5N6HJU4_9EURO|nr:uncharacterized protein BDV37DRAFT_55216 [Aspergillus pseudonomiae]KAB8253590.1 hypothetical protein BDV32DRAFT_33400 [Aspergillus pseudonomiae]KAE8397521.1 hypothetical protein BDV37DRAFT_55216 [Aspergillus pseudonomiae]